MVVQLVLGLLAQMIVAWFSRRREYRADQGGAQLKGAGAMISALRRLDQNHQSSLPKSMAAFGINGEGVASLFRSHPPIAERIRALQNPR
jgi:heat shock protein HtpX